MNEVQRNKRIKQHERKEWNERQRKDGKKCEMATKENKTVVFAKTTEEREMRRKKCVGNKQQERMGKREKKKARQRGGGNF